MPDHNVHNVKLSLPTFPLGNSKCTFDVFEGGEKLGTFQISKGGLRWTPVNGKTPKFKGWRKLRDFFES